MDDELQGLRETTNRLAERLVEPRGLLRTELRFMEVTQVTGTTATLKAGQVFDPDAGALADVLFGPGIRFSSPFVPSVGAQVAVLRNRSDYLIVGTVGGEWRQGGTDTMSVTTAQSQNTKVVPFPFPFTATPRILLTMQDSLFRVVVRVATGSASPTGFTANIATTDTLNFGSNQTLAFAWEAVGT